MHTVFRKVARSRSRVAILTSISGGTDGSGRWGNALEDDAPAAQHGVVERALDDLSFAVAGHGRRSEAQPLEHAISVWRPEAFELDALVASDQVARPQRWRLEQAANPDLVASLVTIRPVGIGQAIYFLPVMVAWLGLGAAEYYYAERSKEETKLSFFAWWSEQGELGPATFSWVLGALVAFLFGVALYSRRRARTLRRLQAELDTRCVALAFAVSAALGNLETRRTDADAIGRSSANLLEAAKELQRVADGLSSGSTGSAAVEAVGSLGRALGQLERQVERIVAGTQTMATTVDLLPTRLDGLTTDLEAFASLRELLQEHATSTKASSERFARGAESIHKSLPLVEVTIGRSHELADELLSAEKSVRGLAGKLDATYAAVAGGVATQLEALREAVAALSAVADSMRAAAKDLEDGIVVRDSLRSD